MSAVKINDHQIQFCQFELSYLDGLFHYLQDLSLETRKRFGPHPFTKSAIIEKLVDHNNYKLYVGVDLKDRSIISYAIIKMGWVESDASRLISYGLSKKDTDCTLAPSVTDSWHSKGIGSAFFKFLLEELRSVFQIERIILWGGVQVDNDKAMGIYRKFGFKILGYFEHNGSNLDMILEL